MWNNAVSNWDAAVELAAERHMTSQQRHAHAQSVFGDRCWGAADGRRRLGPSAAGDEGAARTATSQELEWLLCGWQRRLRLLERDDRLQWNAGGMPRRRRGLVRDGWGRLRSRGWRDAWYSG